MFPKVCQLFGYLFWLQAPSEDIVADRRFRRNTRGKTGARRPAEAEFKANHKMTDWPAYMASEEQQKMVFWEHPDAEFPDASGFITDDKRHRGI